MFAVSVCLSVSVCSSRLMYCLLRFWLHYHTGRRPSSQTSIRTYFCMAQRTVCVCVCVCVRTCVRGCVRAFHLASVLVQLRRGRGRFCRGKQHSSITAGRLGPFGCDHGRVEQQRHAPLSLHCSRSSQPLHRIGNQVR